MKQENKLITIRKEGHSRVIAVTKILPENWIYATVKTIKETETSVTIKFDKVQ